MPKWIVDVTRMGYANREVTVEADTAQAAEHMALAMAGGLEFSEHHSDYEAMGCVPVQEAPTELTEAELRAIDLACMCLLENVRRGKQFQAEAIAALASGMKKAFAATEGRA